MFNIYKSVTIFFAWFKFTRSMIIHDRICSEIIRSHKKEECNTVFVRENIYCIKYIFQITKNIESNDTFEILLNDVTVVMLSPLRNDDYEIFRSPQFRIICKKIDSYSYLCCFFIKSTSTLKHQKYSKVEIMFAFDGKQRKIRLFNNWKKTVQIRGWEVYKHETSHFCISFHTIEVPCCVILDSNGLEFVDHFMCGVIYFDDMFKIIFLLKNAFLDTLRVSNLTTFNIRVIFFTGTDFLYIQDEAITELKSSLINFEHARKSEIEE